MAGYGTGTPLWFECPTYRRIYHKSRTTRDRQWHTLVRTGRVKPRPHNGKQHMRRTLDERHEYVCLGCGHRGWTTNKDILRRVVDDSRQEA